MLPQFQIEAVDYGTEGPVTCALGRGLYLPATARYPGSRLDLPDCVLLGSAHLKRFKVKPQSNTLGSTPPTGGPRPCRYRF